MGSVGDKNKLSKFPNNGNKLYSDDSIDSAYCFPILENNEQNSLEIVLVSVTCLSFIIKVSDMELLSWTPVIESKTLHVCVCHSDTSQ